MKTYLAGLGGKCQHCGEVWFDHGSDDRCVWVLGPPLQALWDAWTPSEAEVLSKGEHPDHFVTTLLHQILEVREALAANPEHANAEICDIISVALNWMRARGYTESEVAAAIIVRASGLAEKGPSNIFAKYRARYDI